LKTENLAIVLTDIAGYTEATQKQSRLDNARLLNTHNRILYPIVRRYKGRHVKSIGDALLLVFRSPTDAMLCAMAMQDALFEFNRNAPKEQQIHIRVAASLGEVRVTRNDVFGEAVNVTSRIESITPVDEIYMSEAVYMAMNKAEVPSQEVGRRELKGISGPISLFNIPRFSSPRLVPQDVMAAEDMSDLVYPYGGAHLVETDADGGWRARLGGPGPSGRFAKTVLASLVLLPLSLLAVFYGPALFSGKAGAKPAVTAQVADIPLAARPPQYQPEFTASEIKTAARPVAPEPKKTVTSASAPLTKQNQPEFKNSDGVARRPVAVANPYPRISIAKKAYKDKKISKDEYKNIVERLETSMKTEIGEAKADYKSDRITKKEYKDRVDAIEKKYK
jgi:class 3 adenylate cyclase